MLILIAAIPASLGVSLGAVYASLMVGGLYFLIYRMFLVFGWSKQMGLTRDSGTSIERLRASLARNWTSLVMFLGIVIPVLFAFGPLFDYLEKPGRVGADSMGTISIIVWVPILITAIAFIEGRPSTPGQPGRSAQRGRQGDPAVCRRRHLAVRGPVCFAEHVDPRRR